MLWVFIRDAIEREDSYTTTSRNRVILTHLSLSSSNPKLRPFRVYSYYAIKTILCSNFSVTNHSDLPWSRGELWCCLFWVLFVFVIYLLSSFGTIFPRNTFPCFSSAFSMTRFVSLSDECGCCMLLAIRHPPLYSTTQQETKPNPPETRKRMLKSEERPQRLTHGAQCRPEG